MKKDEKNERRRLAAEGARKQLTEGTWPQVMMVFGYLNPKAPRTLEDELDRLKVFYEQAVCPSIAEFVELVRFAEKEHSMTMSFKFSTRRRLVPGEAPEPTAENAMLLFTSCDILVGTRYGAEGAAVWLKNFSEAMSHMAPEQVQVMDKIFAEAVEFLKGPSRKTTLREMLKDAVLGEGETLESPKVSKH